jgi:hypothetical protein
MFESLWAEVKNGKIELPEHIELPEGSRVMVTVLSVPEKEFRADQKQTLFGETWQDPAVEDSGTQHE